MSRFSFFFFFNDTATTEIYTLSLHDALPIYDRRVLPPTGIPLGNIQTTFGFLDPYGSELRDRSEEHTSELQSHSDLVCRLLLEKKKKKKKKKYNINTIIINYLRKRELIATSV